jgi:hypothetical protein
MLGAAGPGFKRAAAPVSRTRDRTRGLPGASRVCESHRLGRVRNQSSLEVEVAQQAIGFEDDIRPLFRDKDIRSMSSRFDLSSYGDVKANADQILAKLADGSMPCDGAWPADQVGLFREWVDAGCPG